MVAQNAARYFTPYEVACHSSPDDCWVSCLGNVYDLTQLVKVLLLPLPLAVLQNAVKA